jgi:serine/threonine protein kinase
MSSGWLEITKFGIRWSMQIAVHLQIWPITLKWKICVKAILLRFVMRYVLPKHLRHLWKKCSARIKHWSKQVAQTLYYLHSHNVIYRDVKSDNVLLFSNEDVKISELSSSAIAERTLWIFKLIHFSELQPFFNKGQVKFSVRNSILYGFLSYKAKGARFTSRHLGTWHHNHWDDGRRTTLS